MAGRVVSGLWAAWDAVAVALLAAFALVGCRQERVREQQRLEWQRQAMAWHLEQLGEHGCCWLIRGEQCGLLCGHDGEHELFTPGQYLRMPRLLPPLGALRFDLARWPWKRCPMCSERVDGVGFGDTGTHVWAFWDQDNVARRGGRWEFSPCGCEAFEADR